MWEITSGFWHVFWGLNTSLHAVREVFYYSPVHMHFCFVVAVGFNQHPSGGCPTSQLPTEGPHATHEQCRTEASFRPHPINSCCPPPSVPQSLPLLLLIHLPSGKWLHLASSPGVTFRVPQGCSSYQQALHSILSVSCISQHGRVIHKLGPLAFDLGFGYCGCYWREHACLCSCVGVVNSVNMPSCFHRGYVLQFLHTHTCDCRVGVAVSSL